MTKDATLDATPVEPATLARVSPDLGEAEPGAVVVALPEALDRAIELVPPAGEGPFRRALAIAAAAHLTFALALISTAPPSGFWDGGAKESSIDVDVISADMLGGERVTVRREAVEASPTPPLPKPAEPEPPAERTALTQVPEDLKIDPDVLTLLTARQLALPKEAPEIPTPSPAKAEDVKSERAAAAPPAPETQTAQIDNTMFSTAGRAAIDPSREVTVAATVGQISAYARSIVQILDKRKPVGRPDQRGIVYVQFQLSETGEVVAASVSRSSGKALLDDAAVEAVQGARFPPPPPGSTPAQRLYETHFNFR